MTQKVCLGLNKQAASSLPIRFWASSVYCYEKSNKRIWQQMFRVQGLGSLASIAGLSRRNLARSGSHGSKTATMRLTTGNWDQIEFLN